MRRPQTALVESVAAAAAVGASVLVLLARLVRDVGREPLFVDEVVTAMTATRPVGEMLGIVVLDRGGAPGHFVLAHVAFLVHASAGVLRWLSIACAIGALLLAYDLGRRLHSRLAGVGAAVVVATSPLVGVYGTFGRMYALFAFVGAAAADLLVRAHQAGTTRTVIEAGAVVALLPLVHPYGLLPAALVAGAAAFRWRRRWRHLAVLGLAAALVAVPVALASVRLSDRFGVARHNRATLLSPSETIDYVWLTLGDYAGTSGAAVLVPLLFALAGAFALRTSRRSFVVVALLAVALPFLLLAVLPTGRPQGLAHVSTRHMIFWLPCYAALIGVGGAHVLGRLPRPVMLGVGALFAAFLTYVGPGGISDPRESSTLNVVTAKPRTLRDPADWLREATEPRDLLYFASPLWAAALPDTRDAWLLDAAPGGILGRTLERVDFPVPGGAVAIPVGFAEVELAPLARLERADVYASDRWLVIRAIGPLADEREALDRLHEAWVVGMESVPNASRRLRAHLRQNETNLCAALRRAGGNCVPGSAP
ncbi:MAG TPA: glycosyltransferase family 39 protein [Gaiellaceae bacterium]|nr:glycosyltransferase family 39 protein [Gaiellaceae bacterium]